MTVLHEVDVWTDQVLPTANLTAKRAVTHLGAVAGANARILGVARADAVSGDKNPATVGVIGKFHCEAGGAIADGDALSTDASGRFVTRTSTNPIVGYARQAASGAGVTFLAQLTGGAAAA